MFLTKLKFTYTIDELKSVNDSLKDCTFLPGELTSVINGFGLSRGYGG